MLLTEQRRMNMIQEKTLKDDTKRYRAKVYNGGVKENIYSSWYDKKKKAQLEETELKYQLQNGLYIKETAKTLDEAFEIYIDVVAPNRMMSEAVEQRKAYYINHVKPTLGKRQLTSIKAYEFQKLWKQKQSEIANATIIKLHTLLNQLYKSFVSWGELKTNPLDGVSKPPANYKQAVTWNKEQASKFLNVAKSHGSYLTFWLLLNTGVRIAEAQGLTWDKLDTVNHTLLVDQQYKEREKRIVHWTKTNQSNRKISLTESQVNFLLSYKEKQVTETNVICSTDVGTPHLKSNLRRYLNRFSDQVDVPRVTLHGMRHTHGSILADMGESVKYIQERLGHKDVKTTLNFYIHTQESHHQQTAMRFDNYFNS